MRDQIVDRSWILFCALFDFRECEGQANAEVGLCVADVTGCLRRAGRSHKPLNLSSVTAKLRRHRSVYWAMVHQRIACACDTVAALATQE
jgi:hypothetical protein